MVSMVKMPSEAVLDGIAILSYLLCTGKPMAVIIQPDMLGE
jgi:hypothetical protein